LDGGSEGLPLKCRLTRAKTLSGVSLPFTSADTRVSESGFDAADTARLTLRCCQHFGHRHATANWPLALCSRVNLQPWRALISV